MMGIPILTGRELPISSCHRHPESQQQRRGTTMYRLIQKLVGCLAVGLVLALGLVPGAAAKPAPQASDPVAVVDAWLAASDPAALLNMVTDDVTLRIVPPPPGTPGVWSGKDQTRELFEFGRGQNGHVELVGSWQVTGNIVSGTVSGTVLVTVNDFRKSGVGAVQHQYDFVVQDGKIKSWTGTMAEFERPRVQAAAQAYAAAHPAPAPVGMPTT